MEQLPVRSKDANFPFVSVITPTYNRRRFIPYLIQCYKEQTYKLDRMEWVILDDGQDKVQDLFQEAAKTIPNIRYYPLDEKLTIGAKRNKLNDLATGEIIIAMDDDDYYCPDRVKHAVHSLKSKPNVELAGSSEIYLYYSDIQQIYKFGPYNPNHATNGTMAWRKSYSDKHRYDEFVTHSEEKSFLDEYKNPMVQLNPFKVMLVMAHSENTFDKKKMREDLSNPFVKKTSMKIKDFIKEPKMRTFFATA